MALTVEMKFENVAHIYDDGEHVLTVKSKDDRYNAQTVALLVCEADESCVDEEPLGELNPDTPPDDEPETTTDGQGTVEF